MENKNFMTIDVLKFYAYKIVKQLNEELNKLDYLTFSGKVNANYKFVIKSSSQMQSERG